MVKYFYLFLPGRQFLRTMNDIVTRMEFEKFFFLPIEELKLLPDCDGNADDRRELSRQSLLSDDVQRKRCRGTLWMRHSDRKGIKKFKSSIFDEKNLIV